MSVILLSHVWVACTVLCSKPSICDMFIWKILSHNYFRVRPDRETLKWVSAGYVFSSECFVTQSPQNQSRHHHHHHLAAQQVTTDFSKHSNLGENLCSGQKKAWKELAGNYIYVHLKEIWQPMRPDRLETVRAGNIISFERFCHTITSES